MTPRSDLSGADLTRLLPPCDRELFPITRGWTYLQNASVGPLSTRVLEMVRNCLAAPRKSAAPHLYHDADDVDRLVDAVSRAAAAAIPARAAH